MKKLENESLNYWKEYISIPRKRVLPKGTITKICEYIKKQEQENEEFINKLPQCYLWKLAVIQLMREGNLEIFKLGSGTSVIEPDPVIVMLKMYQILKLANKKEIEL